MSDVQESLSFHEIRDGTDEAFDQVWEARPEAVASVIAAHFDLDPQLVLDLARYDDHAMRNIAGEQMRRKDSLKKKILSRFVVIEKNRRIMNIAARQLGDFTRPRNYLDVGCGMGLTLYDARRLGFARCDGLEVDPAFIRRAEIVCASLNDPDIKADLSDFLTHDFDKKYDLITFFDVFEHIADRDLALDRAADLLTDDGIIYVYQGNYQSSEIVRFEPHYRVPGLSLLHRNRQIDMLQKMGKITQASDFVVNQWPELELFASNPKLSCLINASPDNIRGNRPYRSHDLNVRQLRGMVREESVWEFEKSPDLNASDIDALKAGIADLVGRMDAGDPTTREFNARYSQGSWEFFLARAERPRNISSFSPLAEILSS